MSETMPFRQDAYEKGKEAQAAFAAMVRPHLSKHEKLIEEPFGRHDVDFGLQSFGRWVCFIGVQRRCKSWKSGKFPYETVHVPDRYMNEVKKYASMKNVPYVFVMMADNLRDYITLSSKVILEHLRAKKIVNVDSYRGSDEHVDIPIDAAGVVWRYQNQS